MTTIPANGLNHLALPVKDPEQSAQFYADLFNMEITSSSPEIAFLKTVDSTDMLTLNRSKVAIASGKESLHFGFIVTPDQFDAALRTIKEKSVEKVSEPRWRSKRISAANPFIMLLRLSCASTNDTMFCLLSAGDDIVNNEHDF